MSRDEFVERAFAVVVQRSGSRALSPAPGQLPDACARLVGADLYLAVACDRHSNRAWECFVRSYAPLLTRIAVRHGATEAEAQELVESLPGQLLAGRGQAPGHTLLAGYDGSGQLLSWLSIVLLRRLWSRRQATVREAEECRAAAARRAAAVPATAEDAARRESGGRYREALRHVWSTLSDRERLALKLRYADGVKQRQIARLFGVQDPQVSRILAAAVRKLREGFGAAPATLAAPTSDALWAELRDVLAQQLETSAVERAHGGEDERSTDPRRPI
ncbi:MAG: sigma-70 family RNA polymerase sigma factor [Planctomycetes bacterium]|nr:sigma-70 family RNA polymerase sigma factor [Planctomycetota bacterium]